MTSVACAALERDVLPGKGFELFAEPFLVAFGDHDVVGSAPE